MLDTPREEYTRALLAAVPVADPRRRARRLRNAPQPTTEESA